MSRERAQKTLNASVDGNVTILRLVAMLWSTQPIEDEKRPTTPSFPTVYDLLNDKYFSQKTSLAFCPAFDERIVGKGKSSLEDLLVNGIIDEACCWSETFYRLKIKAFCKATRFKMDLVRETLINFQPFFTKQSRWKKACTKRFSFYTSKAQPLTWRRCNERRHNNKGLLTRHNPNVILLWCKFLQFQHYWVNIIEIVIRKTRDRKHWKMCRSRLRPTFGDTLNNKFSRRINFSRRENWWWKLNFPRDSNPLLLTRVVFFTTMKPLRNCRFSFFSFAWVSVLMSEGDSTRMINLKTETKSAGFVCF